MRKNSRSRRVTVIGALLIVLIGALIVIRLSARGDSRPLGDTARQRIEYINSFGWEVGAAPVSVKEIRIPADFDEIYEEYNDIQRRQGFDLRKYRACRAKKYTYEILNYNEDSHVPICAELIVYGGRIIAADIASSEADGLLTVLAKN